jgi:hypothetical protein
MARPLVSQINKISCDTSSVTSSLACATHYFLSAEGVGGTQSGWEEDVDGDANLDRVYWTIIDNLVRLL